MRWVFLVVWFAFTAIGATCIVIMGITAIRAHQIETELKNELVWRPLERMIRKKEAS